MQARGVASTRLTQLVQPKGAALEAIKPTSFRCGPGAQCTGGRAAGTAAVTSARLTQLRGRARRDPPRFAAHCPRSRHSLIHQHHLAPPRRSGTPIPAGKAASLASPPRAPRAAAGATTVAAATMEVRDIDCRFCLANRRAQVRRASPPPACLDRRPPYR
jgi:hypothetical protein